MEAKGSLNQSLKYKLESLFMLQRIKNGNDSETIAILQLSISKLYKKISPLKFREEAEKMFKDSIEMRKRLFGKTYF